MTEGGSGSTPDGGSSGSGSSSPSNDFSGSSTPGPEGAPQYEAHPPAQPGTSESGDSAPGYGADEAYAAGTDPSAAPTQFTPFAPGVYPAFPSRPQRKVSVKAIVALVVSCTALPICYLGLLLGPLGAIFGHLGMSEAKKDPEHISGYGIALGGAIVGWLTFAVNAGLILFLVLTPIFAGP